MHVLGRRLVALSSLAAILIACASAPSPPTATPVASPVVSCEPTPFDHMIRPDGTSVLVPSPLTCDKALRAALPVVPAGHPPIEKIAFHYDLYGAAWPLGASGYYTDRAGFVLFTLLDGGTRVEMSVIVYADDAGKVKAQGTWRPFPCCEATPAASASGGGTGRAPSQAAALLAARSLGWVSPQATTEALRPFHGQVIQQTT